MPDFIADLPAAALPAFHGVSPVPGRQAPTTRRDCAGTLTADLGELPAFARKPELHARLVGEFARYRAGDRRHSLAYRASNARRVSSFIAGPANFPAPG